MTTAHPLTIVIKLGTSSIVHEKTHEPKLSTLTVIVETAVKLRRDGHRVVIVSSGAIGVALQMMDLEQRPKSLPQVQALAALGQCRLMSIWYRFFRDLRQPVAQILLTRNDIADRTQYLNAQNTLKQLLEMGVIPIVNENDTLSVAEIKFGDNDTLSAITSAMLSADYLFLMTDVDCLYTANPRLDSSATPIEVVADMAALDADVSSAGSALGTGGMSTKIVAAKLATSAGVTTVITQSSKPGNVAEIVAHCETLRRQEPGAMIPHAPLHTRFLPSTTPMRDRSFWLLHGLAPRGTLYIDEGAHRALRDKAGLLPVGVVDVEGNFAQQEAVRLVVVRRRSVATVNGLLGNLPGTLADQDKLNGRSEVSSYFAPARVGLAGYESLSSFDAPPPSTPGTVSATMSGFQTPLSPTGGSLSSTPIAETIAALTTPAPDSFERVDPAPREIGRALVNYAATEVARIKGMKSHDIAGVLGYADSDYVALRQNVSLFSEGSKAAASVAEPSTESQKMGDLGSFA